MKKTLENRYDVIRTILFVVWIALCSAMFNRPRVLTSVAQPTRLPSSVKMLKGDLRKEACKEDVLERLSKLLIVSCGADCYFSIQSDALMLLREGVADPSVAW